MSSPHIDCEYVVVGSGAGGGTVAARLAEAGKHVVLLEAGGDPKSLAGGDEFQPGVDRLPYDYEIPAFHAFASENEAMKWGFFVRHYADDGEQLRDPKYCAELDGKRVDGVLYPRAGTLGGCTAHNAMIFVYPHNEDWDYIARLTGDESWKADSMRRYFERLESCGYRPLWRWLNRLGVNPTRHGWKGWLPTEQVMPIEVLRDPELADMIVSSAFEAFVDDGSPLRRLSWFGEGRFDPNDWRLVRDNAIGIACTPLTTHRGERVGTRERVLSVARRKPEHLRIVLNALATKVLFDADNRAIGVEYLRGERLYRAHARPNDSSGEYCVVRASHEVILAGGAFNTPQLLMLSGIGSPDALRRYDIPVRVNLPGVGKNLQDRYEIGVVNRMNRNWEVYDGVTFAPGDRQYQRWRETRSGVYAGNGSVLTLFRRSPAASDLPDIFCMSLLSRFCGYFPSYSRSLAEHLNYLTWMVLKAHTRNRAGQVTLRSADPRDTPLIDFNYFAEGADDDLDAVVDGIRFVRKLAAPLRKQRLIVDEELPGDEIQTADQLKAFVRANAWGHHASCSCPIGPADGDGVLSADFRVLGTHALRVVDASVFPRIPGFFIVSAVYMIGEKAADVILREAARP